MVAETLTLTVKKLYEDEAKITGDAAFIADVIDVLLMEPRLEKFSLERKAKLENPLRQVDDNGDPAPPPVPTPADPSVNPFAYVAGAIYS